MSFTNIKLKSQSERGFTIVELLIVVVVIAILAAITIVSYNGITSRANAAASKAALGTAQKKIELYNSEVGNFPVSLANMSGDSTKSYYLPSNAISASAPDSTTGKTLVQVQACKNSAAALSTTNVTGTRITYYEFDKSGGPGLTNVDVGTCSTVSPASVLAMPAS